MAIIDNSIVKMKATDRVFWISIAMVLLILLAIVRWLPGGDALSPEASTRGWVEVGLLLVALLIMVLVWGLNFLFVGFSSPTFVISIIFSLWAMLTALWSPNFVLSFGKSISLLSILVLTAGVAQKCKQVDIPASKVLFLSLTIMIGFLFVVNFYHFQSFIPVDWSSTRPRFTFGFNHPNTTATLFVFHILSGLEVMSKHLRKNMAKVLGVVVIGVSGLFLYLTNSRTSILLLIMCAGVFAILQLKGKKERIIGLSILSICFGVIFIALLTGVSDKILMAFFNWQENRNTVPGRIRMWSFLLKGLPAVNLFGFGYYAPRFYNLDKFIWGYTAHNSYLEIYATTGMIGFSLLFFFFISINKVIFNANRYSLSFVFIIYTAIASFLETRLFVPGISMAFLVLIIFETNLGTVPLLTPERGETYEEDSQC